MTDVVVQAMNDFYDRLTDAGLLAMVRDDGRCKAMLDEGVPCEGRAEVAGLMCASCFGRHMEPVERALLEGTGEGEPVGLFGDARFDEA